MQASITSICRSSSRVPDGFCPGYRLISALHGRRPLPGLGGTSVCDRTLGGGQLAAAGAAIDAPRPGRLALVPYPQFLLDRGFATRKRVGADPAAAESSPAGAAAAPASDAAVGGRYSKLSQREHVLKRPEPYVGAMLRQRQVMWTLVGPVPGHGTGGYIAEKEVDVAPALYKIFDEILVNAADNVQRPAEGTQRMSYVRVSISAKDCTITVENGES